MLYPRGIGPRGITRPRWYDHKAWYTTNKRMRCSNKRHKNIQNTDWRKTRQPSDQDIQVMLMQSKMKHSEWLDKAQIRLDLHYWKKLRQTIQSSNCALARRLKHRNECIVYGGWFTSVGILLYMKIIVLMLIKPHSPSRQPCVLATALLLPVHKSEV